MSGEWIEYDWKNPPKDTSKGVIWALKDGTSEIWFPKWIPAIWEASGLPFLAWRYLDIEPYQQPEPVPPDYIKVSFPHPEQIKYDADGFTYVLYNGTPKAEQEDSTEPEMPDEIFAWPEDDEASITRGWCDAKKYSDTLGEKYTRADLADKERTCRWVKMKETEAHEAHCEGRGITLTYQTPRSYCPYCGGKVRVEE